MGIMVKLVNKSFKIRIYPNKEQEEKLIQNIGCARFVYNSCLEANEVDYGLKVQDNLEDLKVGNKTYFNNHLNTLKKVKSWLREAESTCLQASYERLIDSLKRFFKGQNKYPRYKSKHNPVQSIKIKANKSSNDKLTIRFEDNMLKLPKIGLIKYKDNRKITGRILSATISHKANRWYASINCTDVPVESKTQTGVNIGLDLGLTNFCILSNGEKITKLDVAREENQYRRLQRALSRKTLGSANFNKNKLQLAHKYQKIVDKRNDYLQKISTRLVNEFDIICIESLNVKGMSSKGKAFKKGLNRSILNASWSKFTDMLKYKSEWYDKSLSQIDRFFPSSKTCSSCGYKHDDFGLHIRKWVCPVCKTTHDRDVNAAINILNEGLKLISTVGTTGI